MRQVEEVSQRIDALEGIMHAGLEKLTQELIGTHEAGLEKVKQELMGTLLETGATCVYVGFILLDTASGCVCVHRVGEPRASTTTTS